MTDSLLMMNKDVNELELMDEFTSTLENMYVTPNFFDMEQHQEQHENNRSIVFKQLVWRKPFGVTKKELSTQDVGCICYKNLAAFSHLKLFPAVPGISCKLIALFHQKLTNHFLCACD